MTLRFRALITGLLLKTVASPLDKTRILHPQIGVESLVPPHAKHPAKHPVRRAPTTQFRPYWAILS